MLLLISVGGGCGGCVVVVGCIVSSSFNGIYVCDFLFIITAGFAFGGGCGCGSGEGVHGVDGVVVSFNLRELRELLRAGTVTTVGCVTVAVVLSSLVWDDDLLLFDIGGCISLLSLSETALHC